MSAKWYLGTGAQNDVVISTRIHIVRNLAGCPFPSMLGLRDKLAVNEIVRRTSYSLPEYSFNYAEMKMLSQAQVVSLAERHLVSPEFASSSDGRALLLTEDESVSIMLNEEDHIRLQVMYAGFALDEAYTAADKIERLLSERLRFAFDERLGYLTQEPALLGTGMRASVVLHLPALAASSRITKLIASVGKLGLTLRGSYGEGAAARGDMFILSNSVTLGITEKTAINNLRSITLQIAASERSARSELCASPETEDRIFRAYGTLKYARMLDTEEFMGLISLVRLGSVMGILGVDRAKLEELMIQMQPATVSLSVDRPLDKAARDSLRARLVRTALD